MTETQLARAVAARYGGWLRWYVRSKISTDPVYELSARELIGTSAPLLDIGCGAGLFDFYLRERGFRAPIRGIDSDARKIAAAVSAKDKDDTMTDFVHGIVDSGTRFSGSVALLDVLHYLDESSQRRLLEQAASFIAPGGLLLIRDSFADGSWRASLTRVEERFAIALGWLKGGTVHFPTRRFLEDALQDRFSLTIVPAYGRTPFNNHLLVGRLRA